MQITYKDGISGERWLGFTVHPENDYICVTMRDGAYFIYNTVTGKPFLKIAFATKDAALSFGKMLHEWYGQYMWLWDDPEWVKRDLPALVQYTIPQGVQILEALEKMKHMEIVDESTIRQLFSGLVQHQGCTG